MKWRIFLPFDLLTLYHLACCIFIWQQRIQQVTDTKEAIIMVATDKILVFVWQVAEPVEEINGFMYGANHTEIIGMHYDIGFG